MTIAFSSSIGIRLGKTMSYGAKDIYATLKSRN